MENCPQNTAFEYILYLTQIAEPLKKDILFTGNVLEFEDSNQITKVIKNLNAIKSLCRSLLAVEALRQQLKSRLSQNEFIDELQFLHYPNRSDTEVLCDIIKAVASEYKIESLEESDIQRILLETRKILVKIRHMKKIDN